MAGNEEHQAEAAPAAPEVVSAPAPAPSTSFGAATSSAAVALAGGTARGVRPEQVLALQRSVGNAAMAAVLARQDKPPEATPGAAPTADPAATKPVSAADFSVAQLDKPTPTDEAKAALTGENVIVHGGHVTFHATATLKAALDHDVSVGFIQTVTSSDKYGVYTEDGTMQGKRFVDKHLSQRGEVRDAKGHLKTDAGGNPVRVEGKPVVEETVLAPWYDTPSVISAGQTTAELNSSDRTKAVFPLTQGKGKLAGVRGRDNFRLSLGVKDSKTGTLIHLAAVTWSSPMDMDLDPSTHGGTGAKAAVGEMYKNEDLDKIPTANGLAITDFTEWLAAPTPEGAKAMSTAQLFFALPMARRNDPGAYEVMATELRERKPKFTVKVDQDDNMPTDDHILLSAAGVRGAKPREFKGDGTATYELFDFFDPNDITDGSAITISINPAGEPVQEYAWKFPWRDVDRTFTFKGWIDSVYKVSLSKA